MKKSRYNILSNFGDKHLLYNTVTGATVLLNDEYYSQYVSNDKKADIANYFSNMEKGGFYVADEIDEFARLTNIMQDSMKSNRILSLTIAPTLSCNFRCPYCYETGRKYNTMTPSIVSDVIHFIHERIEATQLIDGKHHVSISWYGGEPLLQPKIIEQITRAIELHKNVDVLQKIHTISLLDVRSENAASLTQKINNDSYQVSSFFLEFFSNSVINLIMGLFAICYTFYYNLGIALILIGSISAYALLYSLLRKKVYISSLSYKEAQGLFFGKLYEQLDFLPFIKAFEASSKMLNQLDSAFSILYKKAIVYQNTSFSFSMLDSFFEIVIQVLFFIVSGVYIFHQKMSIGEFSILLSLSRTSMRGIKYFFSMGKNLQETKASFDRISKIVCASVPKDGTYKLVEIHSINLTGLNFQYRSKVVFKNLNYSFYEGYIYGVLGENGSGKTTLAYILMGIYNASNLFINGISSTRICFSKLREKNISYCESEPILLNETIEYNITLGETYSSTDIKKFTDILGLFDQEENAHLCLNTIVDSSLSNISSGEKQKIALIRTLIRNRHVMIFDEPTSALDAKARLNLMKYLKSVKRNHLIIVITHDDTLIPYFDKIITLQPCM